MELSNGRTCHQQNPNITTLLFPSPKPRSKKTRQKKNQDKTKKHRCTVYLYSVCLSRRNCQSSGHKHGETCIQRQRRPPPKANNHDHTPLSLHPRGAAYPLPLLLGEVHLHRRRGAPVPVCRPCPRPSHRSRGFLRRLLGMLHVLESLGVLKAEEGVKGLRAASVTFELSRRLGKGREGMDGWMGGRMHEMQGRPDQTELQTACVHQTYFAFFYCFCCSCVIQERTYIDISFLR